MPVRDLTAETRFAKTAHSRPGQWHPDLRLRSSQLAYKPPSAGCTNSALPTRLSQLTQLAKSGKLNFATTLAADAHLMACVEELPAKAVEEATRIAAKSDLEITVLDFTKLRA